jgi:hypothetical protein
LQEKKNRAIMACPPIPQPKHQNLFFCVQSPGFYKPLAANEVKIEFSKAMCSCSNYYNGFGDVEKIPKGSEIQGEASDDPLAVTKESIFWQSATIFTDPDVLVGFACGLARFLCNRKSLRVVVVYMPYYAHAPVLIRAATLKYVFGFLISSLFEMANGQKKEK